jgi:uncharacterized cupin superfamily protein
LNDHEVPRLNVDTSEYVSLPEYGGSEAVLYKSADGTRLAGSFRESGDHSMTMPFDAFKYVVAGSVRVTVQGGECHEYGPGDALYLREGMRVDLSMSEDYHDVSMMVSDTAIVY